MQPGKRRAALPPLAAACSHLVLVLPRLRRCAALPAAMAALLKQLNPAISQYKDRRFCGTQQEFEECLHNSTTVYVGNLSFYTTEDQIFEVGPPVDLLMGRQLTVQSCRRQGAWLPQAGCLAAGS